MRPPTARKEDNQHSPKVRSIGLSSNGTPSFSSCEVGPILPCAVDKTWTEGKRIEILPEDVNKEAVRWTCRKADGHMSSLQSEEFTSVFHTASDSSEAEFK